MPLPPAGRRAVDTDDHEMHPSEHESVVCLAAPHRGVHFELQQLPGRQDAEAGAHFAGERSSHPAGESQWFTGIDLDDPIGFLKGATRSCDTGAGIGKDVGAAGKQGDFSQRHGHVRRLVPLRRRPAEQLASAMIFAAFITVAAIVGVICVSSLNAAYQDEKNTEDLLHDARVFVPAKTGGTLPVDSFEDVQRPSMGNELNRLYKESAQHSWAGHDFDVAFVTGDGEASREGSNSPGRVQQLADAPMPKLTIEARLPTAHVHGKRVWGWLHKKVALKETSAAISDNLDKQADYIIGYPDLDENSAARTQRLVQAPQLSRIGGLSLENQLDVVHLPGLHKIQNLGTLPVLGSNKHAENVHSAQQAVSVVNAFIKRTPGELPTFAVPGQGAVHSFIKGSRFTKTLPAETSVTRGSYGGGAEEASATQESKRILVPAGRAVVISRGERQVEPVVIAMPHQAGMPEPIRADVKVVSAPPQQHVPFTWVKNSFQSPPSRPTKTVEEKYFDHAERAAQAKTAAEAASNIIANGEKGKACFQEGHGAEPCPTVDYHPAPVENWQGAPDRPGHLPSKTTVEPTSEVPRVAEPMSEVPSGIDWPTPGETQPPESHEPAPEPKGPLDVEHEHFGPDISKDGDDDDDSLPLPEGVEHQHFTGVTPPLTGATTPVPPAVEDAEERGRDDLSWPTGSNTSNPTVESTGYLTKTVDRLESVVGELSGMMERMMGATPSQNVYVTNNYNNVTVQSANVTSSSIVAANTNIGSASSHDGKSNAISNSASVDYSAASSTSESRSVPVEPEVLPYPDMWPLGGVYADQVVVHLDEGVNGSALYYSVNVSGTQETPMEYTKPFVLGPGWTKVEAVAIEAGYNASAVREAVFRVMNCNGDKCCNWHVVYLRFEAVLGRLLAHKQQIPKDQVALQAAKDAAEVAWLGAESKYQDAKIAKKSAVSEAEYALSFERKWGYAFSESNADMQDMQRKVTGKLRQLLDERELIMDILAKLDSDELSASGAMGMVQESLAQCSACKAWRSIASSPAGDGAATSFALASTLGGHQEVKDVKSILQEILDDLDARRLLYEKMLSGARLQVLGNEKKLKKWADESKDMAATLYKNSKTIEDYSRKAQELAGKVEVAKQAVDQGKQFMEEDIDILTRHISAIRRILKRIRVALEKCPGGAPEEQYPAAPSTPAPKAGNRAVSASSQYNNAASKTNDRVTASSQYNDADSKSGK